MRTTIPVLLVLAAAACGSTEPSDPPSLVPTLEPVTTIGCGECDGLDALAVVSVDITQDRLVVRDRYEPLIRIFDLEGQPVRGFGVFGQGPGEFNPIELPTYAAADGRLFSYGLMSLQEHTLEGDFVTAHEWPMRLPIAQYFEPTAPSLVVLAAPPPTSGGPRERSIEVIEYRPRDPEFGPHLLAGEDQLPYAEEGAARTTATTVAKSSEGRLVLGDSKSYVLHWYGDDGTFVSMAGTGEEAPLMPPEDRRLREEMNQNLGIEREIPERNPHFSSLAFQFDGSDRLWVRTLRWSGEGDARRTTEFDLYDGDGVLLGTVEVPVTFSENWPSMVIRGDLLAGAYLGDDGHTRVGVWRIVG